MDSILDRMNFAVGVSGLTICILGLLQIINSSHLERRIRQYFLGFFFILTAYISCSLMGQMGRGFHEKISLFMESAFSSVLTVMLTRFILEQSSRPNWRQSAAYRISLGLWVGYMLLLVYTQFSTQIYYFDAEWEYHRGPYYPALLVPPVLIMLMNLLILWHRRKHLSKKEYTAFFVYCLAPLCCMIIQMFLFGLYLIVLGSAVGAMFMFYYILDDQMDRYYRKEAENAQLKIDILLAQIQPHFLFNSLTTIRYLCRKDPEKAEKAVTNFIAYLRHNMDSLSLDRPIPFQEELKHVEGYLFLQKLRFGKELKVEYDLECMDFCIPTLTLQPLVENAVTYGVRRTESGAGVVTIRTRKYDDQIEVSVLDDGPGFVPDVLPDDQKRSHTGIKNVRERLMRVVGAELVIDSTMGKGTTATIILPQEEKSC